MGRRKYVVPGVSSANHFLSPFTHDTKAISWANSVLEVQINDILKLRNVLKQHTVFMKYNTLKDFQM